MFVAEECHECAHHQPVLTERSVEEVSARLAQQDQAELDTLEGDWTPPVWKRTWGDEIHFTIEVDQTQYLINAAEDLQNLPRHT